MGTIAQPENKPCSVCNTVCGALYPSRCPQALREATRKYRAENSDKVKARRRELYLQNKEKERENARRWERTHKRVRDPDKVRETARRYRERNRERLRGEGRKRYAANPTRMAEYVRKSRAKNRPHYVALTHKYRAQRDGNGGSYTAQEWQDLCIKLGNVCLCCRRAVKLVVDHIVPVSKGGTSDISNLQPLCKSCNSRKSNQIIDYRE